MDINLIYWTAMGSFYFLVAMGSIFAVCLGRYDQIREIQHRSRQEAITYHYDIVNNYVFKAQCESTPFLK